MKNILSDLISRYPQLASCEKDIFQSFTLLDEAFSRGNKLLVAGNGGSDADANHIVGELMKGFVKKRKIPDVLAQKLKSVNGELGQSLAENLQCAMPAVALSSHSSLHTAYINDVGAEWVFAQQLLGLGCEGDVFLGITTSGNSKNILSAAVTAKALGLKIIALTGKNGGKIADLADVTVKCPETETYKVQELHLPVYHALCLMLEAARWEH